MQLVLGFGHQRQFTRETAYYYGAHAFTAKDYYELLLQYESLTDREASEITGVFPGLISARRNDYINANPGKLIAFKRTCRVTGRTVTAWKIKT